MNTPAVGGVHDAPTHTSGHVFTMRCTQTLSRPHTVAPTHCRAHTLSRPHTVAPTHCRTHTLSRPPSAKAASSLFILCLGVDSLDRKTWRPPQWRPPRR